MKSRASDRVWKKMGNYVTFSVQIMRQEESVVRQIMHFFLGSFQIVSPGLLVNCAIGCDFRPIMPNRTIE